MHIQRTPGLHVVPRGRDLLQVGLGRHATVVDADPLLLDTLVRLVTETTPVSPRLAPLLESGALTAGPVPQDPLSRQLAREHPTDWVERLRRRHACGVAVIGHVAGAAPEPQALLERSGLVGPTTSALVLCDGSPEPAVLDALLRTATPHLLLRTLDGEVRLGPFVVPGLTACAACLEFHAGDLDPAHVDVQRRYREALGADRDPVDTDPAMLALAIGWAVGDLVAHADGERPSTWSTTFTLSPGRTPEPTSWLRHPECGCHWVPRQDRSPSLAG